jgi:prepilin-type N-terminal cleavage/methylation domain-containing protein
VVTRAGFTVIEVMVALVLLSVGVLGAASTGLLATRLLREARVQDEIAERASYLLDSLIADSVKGRGSERSRMYSIDWIATSDSATLTVSTADSTRFTMRALR